MSLDGLRDLDDSQSQSDSSSGTDTSENHQTKTEKRVPYAIVYTDEQGEYHFAHRPQDDELLLLYEVSGNQSEPELLKVPSNIERYWMNRDSFQYAKHAVKEVLGDDLANLIRDDPEAGLKAVRVSLKRHNTEGTISHTETCPVCDDEIHAIYDDYEQVNGRRVCSDHSLTEIKRSGLMDNLGMPSNRMWE